MDFKIIRKLLRDVLRIDSGDVPPCDVLTFACDTDRHFVYEGKAYSPLMNTVEEDLERHGKTCTSVSRVASTLKGDQSHGTVISPEGGFARALVSKRIKGLLKRNSYPYSHAEEREWDKLLEKSGARAVVAILPSRELCQVCKRRGIWVADLQHGVITASHLWYAPGERLHEPSDWVPNAFLVWDEGTAKFLNSWAPTKGVEVKVTGNPWTNRFIQARADDQLLQDTSSLYPKPATKKPQILVSLSWGITNISNGFIHPSLESYMLRTTDHYDWHIRLHPNQIRGFATDEGTSFVSYFGKTFGGTGVQWKMATEMPLPMVLSRTDLHVTWISSICMEAATFGIKSLLLDPNIYPGAEKEDYFDYLVHEGYADKRRPAEQEIEAWVCHNLDVKLPPREDHRQAYMQTISEIAMRASSERQ